jgi:hypothetical protein
MRRLSDALSEPLMKAYRLGGFGLSFLVLGAVFLAGSAAAPRGFLSYVVAGVGLVLVLVPCYFFYVKEIRPVAAARNTVARESELIDSVQATAVEMTLAAHELQSLALANAREIEEFMGFARPALSRIPLLNKILESPQFKQADWFTASVVAATERSEQVIADIQKALIEADPTRLKKYLGEVRVLRADLRKLLRGSRGTSAHAMSDSADTS